MRASLTTSTMVLAGRILLLAIAVTAVLFGYAATRSTTESKTDASYVCPMHPQVISPVPGDCPICRMALEPARSPMGAGALAPALAEGESKEAVTPADSESVTLPEHMGVRGYDARSRAKIFESSLEMRGPAWIESREVCVVLLHHDEAKLLVLNEVGSFSSSTPAPNGAPADVAVQYSGEPAEKWDDRTSLVRMHISPKVAVAVGQTGYVKLATRLRSGLVVKSSAVIASPQGPYVLVVADDRHTLTKRRIEVGNILYGYAHVLSGLRENEYVVAAHAFFFDVERRLEERVPH